MEPTKALRDRLRILINDVIPDGGTDDGATFSDDELNDMIKESSNVYYAAYEGWTIKAGMLEGDIESYTAGNEKYDMTSLKDRLNHYLFMADRYKAKAEEEDCSSSQTAVILKFRPPRVM